MVRPSHDLSNVVVGGIRDYAKMLADERNQEVEAEEAHELLLRIGLVDVGILPPGTVNGAPGSSIATSSDENENNNENDSENDSDPTPD